MRLLNFSIIKLTCFLIIGIAISYAFPLSFLSNLYITGAFFILLTVSFLIARKQFIKTIWFGIAAYILMIFVTALNLSSSINSIK